MNTSSTDELPCTSVDGEFWQCQNIASVITTAIRGGKVCGANSIIYGCAVLNFEAKLLVAGYAHG
ncbi:hypothetical protein GWP43_05640 [Treponema vincentii]|uniref:Uncharacterized protein n=1 Tax=Treponema vincentii TaxID=69710 RepID=A0A6P1Y1C6_9SPIR|nr:hypothetical protein [Treponema vincentii]QHX43013.1 hypothetical protein GWP43_05640 [Treponema vincentii]